jgi:hypothetical protein
MDDIERVGTRKSLRNRSKTWKTTDIEKERVENASDSEKDVIEVDPETPQAPRWNRIRRKSTSTITSTNTLNEGEHSHGESQVLTTILRVVEELRTNNGVSNKIVNELRSNNEQLKASKDQLKMETEELKILTRHLVEELSSVKAQLSEVTKQATTIVDAANTLAQLAAAAQVSATPAVSVGSSTRGSTECSCRPLRNMNDRDVPNVHPDASLSDISAMYQAKDNLAIYPMHSTSQTYPS